jgi:hypothetical protein
MTGRQTQEVWAALIDSFDAETQPQPRLPAIKNWLTCYLFRFVG